MTKCGFIKSLSRTTQGNCHCKRSGGKNPSEARLFLLVLHHLLHEEVVDLVDLVLVDDVGEHLLAVHRLAL